jgi:hypothetical protein
MPSNVNHQRQPSNGHHTDEEYPELLPATIGDLSALQDQLDDIAPALPCWCPDAPAQHLRNCHIEAVGKLARQWTCTGSAGVPGSYRNDCDCPQCRFEWTMGNYTAALNNLAEAIREGDVDSRHRTLREGEGKATPDQNDTERRWQIFVKATEADEWPRASDSYGRPQNIWECPTHPDANPSLHVNPDYETGYLLAHCKSGGDDCGNKYLKDHPQYVEHRKAWIRELARLLDIPTGTFYPIRQSELPPDHEPPF